MQGQTISQYIQARASKAPEIVASRREDEVSQHQALVKCAQKNQQADQRMQRHAWPQKYLLRLMLLVKEPCSEAPGDGGSRSGAS